MPMDGVMLGYVARELHNKLLGGRVDKIAQPERDELNIAIRSLGENYKLLITANPNHARVHLTNEKKSNPLEPSNFCMLLRKHITGSRVADIRQVNGDRIIEIDFEGTNDIGDRCIRTLVCEFMGRHSNIILLLNNKIVDSIRHVDDDMSRIREVLPGLAYQPPKPHGKLCYDALNTLDFRRVIDEKCGAFAKVLSESISGLSQQTAREITERATGNADAYIETLDRDAVTETVCEICAHLPKMLSPTLAMDEHGVPVDVMPFKYVTRSAYAHEEKDTLSDAIEKFYFSRAHADSMLQKSSSIRRVIKNNIARCEKKLGLQAEALAEGDRMELYRIKGELLTANLHAVPRSAPMVEIPNYYDPDNKPMLIELDVTQSPSANVQRYFKLYQKAKSAQRLAADQKASTAEELTYLEGQLDNLEKCTDEAELAEIRTELEKYGYIRTNHNRRQTKQLAPSRPHTFSANGGAVIMVGKNNTQNEKLTFSAAPDAWWLHAKNIPGSHVIIAGDDVGDDVIVMAAEIAAFYSKGKSSDRVQVDYTRRKYVKKPSGAKPGFVIYTHEKTLTVSPKDGVK